MQSPPPPAEELLHELRVHQIELEMQNEALRQAQIAMEESRDRYVDLYDFAPVGYLTLNHEAIINEINLTGAALLGVERNKLLQRRFAHFVAPEDLDRWHRFFVGVLQFEYNERQNCDLLLKRDNDSTFHALLDCLRLETGDKSSVRIVLTDITKRKQAEAKIAEQLDELRRFNAIMMEREMRILEVKREVNQLLREAGQPPRYLSVEQGEAP